jgi:hypothetical protein
VDRALRYPADPVVCCHLRTARPVAWLIPARFEADPGMGHGSCSPGLPAKIAMMMLDHTTTRPVRDAE